jgi:hypothetical protein
MPEVTKRKCWNHIGQYRQNLFLHA